MKRVLLLSLALMLLLCSCSGGHKFRRLEDGRGYTDAKTNLTYIMLDAAFEPASAGETVGKYRDSKRDITVIFHEIPKLDPTQFLTDEDRNVYFAGESVPNAADWSIAAILVCEANVGVERARFSPDTHSATVDRIRTLWFEGENADFLSIEQADRIYSIKLASADYPNLYYSFDFLYYAGESCYFYNAVGRRAVAVPADLADLIYTSVNGEE